jgi:hypothetical protein
MFKFNNNYLKNTFTNPNYMYLININICNIFFNSIYFI